jgi:hypothetical protein
MASESRGYWSRSWQLLTRDEGWIKPLLVLGAARLVPIVGSFGADGYGLEWARLTAWGVDSSPKQKNVNVSACIKTGARAFVVSLGYLVVIGFVRGILTTILGTSLGGLLSAAVGLLGGVVVAVAKLHSAIYQSIGAGYQVPRIVEMIKRDYHGLLRIAGMWAIMSIAIGVTFSVLLGGATVVRGGDILIDLVGYSGYGYDDDWLIANTVLKLLGRMAPALCLLLYAGLVASSFQSLMVTTATGLWMRQFDVANWGEDNEPLPQTAAGTSEGYHVTTMPSSAYTHAPASEPVASAAVQEVPTPVDTPAVVEPQVGDDSIPEPVASPEVVKTFDLVDDEPLAVAETQSDDLAEQPTDDADAQVLERREDEQAALASLDDVEPADEPAAPVEEQEPEVPTFALNGSDPAEEAPAVSATDDPESPVDADTLLAQVSEAIQEADLTTEEQEVASQTVELEVPGQKEGDGDRIVEVIDLTSEPDEGDAQA